MMDGSEYAAHVDTIIGTLAQDHALGRDIDIFSCICGLEPDRRENRKIREFVTKKLKIPGREFDRALRMEETKADLGILPRTARQFVEAYATKKRITARYNGVLRQDEPPYVLNDEGRRDYIPPHLWDAPEFKTMIRTNFRRTVGFAEFQQELRVRATELHLEFNVHAINDAAEMWYSDICRNRLWQIMGAIDYVDCLDVRESGQESLRRLAETCFACDEGVDFVVAAFNKFIWQVKRKIESLPIYHHLMPVILGVQGNGKSTLIRKLLAPIEELWVMSDFKQITDDRNISLWRNYAVFLDEMGWASKSDIDTVKNIITAETLTRRVMRTNVTQEVAQNVTFIGAANATELSELIRDATGTRRFLTLAMRDDPNRAVINSINWHHVWQSVDHTADDPMDRFRDVLSRRQEAERLKTPIEEWLDHMDENKSFMGKLTTDRLFLSQELHSAYREFEMVRFPTMATSITNFVRELKRHANREGGRCFLYHRDVQLLWQWIG